MLDEMLDAFAPALIIPGIEILEYLLTSSLKLN